MTPRSVPRASRGLAFSVAGLLLALPALGLRCETICAEASAPAAPTPSSGHCGSHDEGPPVPADAPTVPDDCRTHEIAAALKKADDTAFSPLSLGALPLAPAAFADPASDSPALEQAESSPGRASKSRPLPLRL